MKHYFYAQENKGDSTYVWIFKDRGERNFRCRKELIAITRKEVIRLLDGVTKLENCIMDMEENYSEIMRIAV